MTLQLRLATAAAVGLRSVIIIAMIASLFAATGALAQSSGGVLRVGWFDSPASVSILEESTIAGERPMSTIW